MSHSYTEIHPRINFIALTLLLLGILLILGRFKDSNHPFSHIPLKNGLNILFLMGKNSFKDNSLEKVEASKSQMEDS